MKEEPKGLTELRQKLSDLPRDMQIKLLESELRLRALRAEREALIEAGEVSTLDHSPQTQALLDKWDAEMAARKENPKE